VIVLDSSLLIAYYSVKDVHHVRASSFMERFHAGEFGRGLLLEYVFLEVVTVLAAKVGSVTAHESGRLLLEAAEFDFVPCSDFFMDTWNQFRAQRETALSFVDAAIVALARRHGGVVASFDMELRIAPGIQAFPD
jgi:predicted nucleic acid-binding protein